MRTSHHPLSALAGLVLVLMFAMGLAGLLAGAGAQTAPPHEDVRLVGGLSQPTAMAIAPDGRIFVAQQGGALRVVKNETLLTTPFLTVPVVSSNERGLLGIAFDPGFAANGFVYVYYTANTSPIVNRVSRFTASSSDPDRADPASETIIVNNIPSESGYHNGGALHFGSDGKLYVAVGEGHTGNNAQSLTTVAGKILRFNSNGTIPTDNPYFASTTGNSRAIWALGLRNPFTFDIQPGTGRMFINDVGQSAWEEVNEAWIGPNNGSNAGFNFGWPATEGATTDPRFHTPFHTYSHSGGVCAITGGAFYNPGTVNFPSEFVGDYFFADYCGGWIKSIDLSTRAVSTLIAAGDAGEPVDIKIGDDGSLYYVDRALSPTASVHRVRYAGNEPPTIVGHPQSLTVPEGAPASFSVDVSGTAPFSYQWQRNSVNIPGATAASYTLASAQPADNGARFRVVVTNSFGTATSNQATLTVTANQPPAAAISAPPPGSTYAGGDVIAYAGTGTDAEDGALPASAFTWRVDFHHASHTHPFLPDTDGSQNGSFTVPTTGHTAADVWYRIHLTVRDSGGLTSSTYRDIQPRTANVALATNVAGLQLELDGQPVATPHSVTGVVGIERLLNAPSPQTVAGSTYEFVSWSDGGAQSHTATTPAADTTYTATYRQVAEAPVNTVRPALSGSARQGQALTTSNGTWSGSTPFTFTYLWRRCDTSGNNCTTIGGATAQSYMLAAADVGSRVYSMVTATNSVGSSSQRTYLSATVLPGLPVNSAWPVLTGTARVGQTLTTSDGIWTGSTPTTYTYAWRRCDVNGNNCSWIGGATSQSYLLVSADIGSKLYSVVTATNATGSASQRSALSAVVVA